MGLTGVILGATVALQRAETAYFCRHRPVQRHRRPDERMSPGDDNYTYSVAWFDAVTRGKHLGRGVLTRGNKARLADLPVKLRRDPLKFVAPSFGTIPEVFPNRMVNKATAKAFSTTWYLKSPKHRVDELQNLTQFFHPLDIVADWNRVYGPNGFLQYQFVVPFGELRDLQAALRDDRQLRPPVLSQRAQALRSGQPVTVVVPDARLDADRRPADRARAGPAVQRAGRAGRRRRRAGVPGQGLTARARRRSGRCTRGSTTSWPYAARSIPPGCSILILLDVSTV